MAEDHKKPADPEVSTPNDEASSDEIPEKDLREVAGGLTAAQKVRGDGLVSCC